MQIDASAASWDGRCAFWPRRRSLLHHDRTLAAASDYEASRGEASSGTFALTMPVKAMRQYTHRRWHLDEIYMRINGVQHYLWRAVDHEG